MSYNDVVISALTCLSPKNKEFFHILIHACIKKLCSASFLLVKMDAFWNELKDLSIYKLKYG